MPLVRHVGEPFFGAASETAGFSAGDFTTIGSSAERGNSHDDRLVMPQSGSLFGKHHGDLAFRRAVDPRVGPARLPAIQVRSRLFDGLEAEPSERGFLRV